jgi:membrane-associated phospholipid phosphatase
MGGLVAMVALTKLIFGYDEAQIGLFGGANLIVPVDILLYGSILMAGAVCTSRLILKAHVIKEVYGGFVVGITSILVAYVILV